MLKEAKHSFKSNNNEYRTKYGREIWELKFNNLTRKWKIILIESLIYYQIQNEEKRETNNKTNYTQHCTAKV